MHRLLSRTALVTAGIAALSAQPAAPPQRPAPAAAPSAPAPAATTPAPPAPAGQVQMVEEQPVVTEHSLRLGGKTLRYKATAGLMPMKAESGEIEAQMFYVAYTLDTLEPKAQRPLTVVFNGGPGAATVWLHMGALGPKRVDMGAEGFMPPPPYRLLDNAGTWLDRSDLVFVDPVGTGYSRAKTPDIGRRYWGVQGDIDAMGRFVRQFLTQQRRWTSPLFLAGESYGTTRAAGLSNWLADHGVGVNGVFLISTILNYQTVVFSSGNEMPYALHLPTYTAIAWYHQKLPAALQQGPVEKAIAASREFAGGRYLTLLAKGADLTEAERNELIDTVSRLTGLDREYVRLADGRIEIQRFTKQLLRAEGKVVGRLDGRYTGFEPFGTAEQPGFDPSLTGIKPPYTATVNAYIRETLGYENDREYYTLGGGIGTPWDFGQNEQGRNSQGFAQTAEQLRAALTKNPHMRIFIAKGYYDLATPFFAADYTISHLGLDPEIRRAIKQADYPAGHMMYVQESSLLKLKRDAAEFYDFALGAAARRPETGTQR